MGNVPFVSVVIPCLNERQSIGGCLQSVIANDYPKHGMEILVVDGMSDDGTRDVVHSYAQRFSYLRLLDNARRIVPTALNIGIRKASGDIIVRMDAHASYERDYISKCVRCLAKYDADNVGGVMITVPSSDTLVAQSIAIALSHPFGAGNSYFRAGSTAPRWVDTVFGGCYRREVFDKVGFFNEKLARSQDMEFNIRLRKGGGKILLHPEIISYYHSRSNLKDFWKVHFRSGFWVVYHLKFARTMFRLRHLVPMISLLSLIGLFALSLVSMVFLWTSLAVLSIYLVANIYSSVSVAIGQRSLGLLFLMPLVFAVRHLSYGIGSLWGIVRLVTG